MKFYLATSAFGAMLFQLTITFLFNRPSTVTATHLTSAVTATAASFVLSNSYRKSSFLGSTKLLFESPCAYNNNKQCTNGIAIARRHLIITMGLQIKIRIVGREKSGTYDQWIQEACSMYTTRLQSSQIQVETEWHKTNDALIKGVSADVSKNNAVVVLLDPNGQMPSSSEAFSEKLYQWLEEGGSRLVFVIGGAEGLPWELKTGMFMQEGSNKKSNRQQQQQKSAALPLLSFSKLTFTHQFARLLLVEQIYRASEIRKGSNYHK